MKKQIMKMGMVAVLVMGAVSGAQAATQAQIEFTGKIVKTACDVTVPDNADQSVSLGAFAASDFTDMTTVHSSHAAPVTLDLGSCSGAAIPAGDTIKLSADQTNASIPVALKGAGLWGDNALGVGIDLTAAKYSGSGALPTTYTAFVPGQGLDLTTAAANEEDADQVSLPKSVLFKAGLRAYAAPASIDSGDIKSTIVFTASYD